MICFFSFRSSLANRVDSQKMSCLFEYHCGECLMQESKSQGVTLRERFALLEEAASQEPHGVAAVTRHWFMTARVEGGVQRIVQPHPWGADEESAYHLPTWDQRRQRGG